MSDTENQVVADLAEQVAEPFPIVTGRAGGSSDHDLYGWVLRGDQKLELLDLADYAPTPARKTGRVTLADADSFVEYVNRHKDSGATTIWSDVAAGLVRAVLDDHATTETPGWGEHRAVLQLKVGEDWAHWLYNDGKLLSQERFAEHLEDGAEAVVDPDAATMLEIAQSFHARKGVNFKSGRRLDSGEVQFVYEETVTARAGQKGDLAVPASFTLGLAPFEGGPTYKLLARFKHRLMDGQLSLGYKLIRPEQVRQLAFADICKQVGEGLDLPVMAGTPRG